MAPRLWHETLRAARLGSRASKATRAHGIATDGLLVVSTMTMLFELNLCAYVY